MREIKLRAWDKKEEKMSYIMKPEQLWYCSDNNGDSYQLIFKGHHHGEPWRKITDYILMQYTGLKDKNGKEIYEGDIIAIEDHVNHIVAFEDGMFMWGNIRPFIPIHEKLEQCPCEIIGNIYENRELLKEKNEKA